ncbi:hypothetical protein ACPXCE_22000 [Streptomyces sp. DT24]|uniref:hypothetical protein n=1 Tax=unclassified Streptomyces TaxID=2593676 RepID=UPI0023B9DA68|nr:hypothetical protein [Streptomyces sp. AM 4-1-1]WEH34901.1 hypothetical protein PZB75_16990 [Streptomyces sp. AM 4-1-1]
MSDFDDLVAAERRRIAAGEMEREAQERSKHEQWEETLSSARALLKAAVGSLRAARAEPVPVLSRRKAGLFGSTDRTVIVDRRWPLGRFALDAEARAYRCGRVMRLRDTWENVDHPLVLPKVRKSRLRTGLSEDQWVMWDEEPIAWSVAEAVRTGGAACFGRAEDGTPLLLPAHSDDEPVPLKQYLATSAAGYNR